MKLTKFQLFIIRPQGLNTHMNLTNDLNTTSDTLYIQSKYQIYSTIHYTA
jgi:hypothetical protein